MSKHLQEIKNLKDKLIRNPQNTIQIGHSCFERIDDNTIKQLCVSCGGKGFYLLMQGFPGRTGNRSGEIVGCEMCEKGFKYSKLGIDEHGNH